MTGSHQPESFMRRVITLLGAVLLAAGSAVAQDEPAGSEDVVEAAVEAAENWLAIVDSAGWAKSHTEAARYFKTVVAPDVWVRQIRGVRTPLGRVVSRTLTDAQYATTLPGAPEGEYVVLTYSTKFENKEGAVETVTPMKDPDGTWRVSGYYVR